MTVSVGDVQTVLENASVGSFSQLSDLVGNSSEGSVISLDNDYQYDENTDENYKDGVELKAITLEGNGHMINGNGKARIFNILSENVTINNLKLVNGYAEKGGAINACYKFTCNDVVFQNNHATSEGGAIYVGSKIDLNSCIFEENFAPKGAAIFFKSAYVPRNDTLPFDPAEFEDDNYTDDNYTIDENDTIDDNESYDNTSDDDFMPKPDSFINYTIFKNFYNISQAVIFADAEQNVEIKNSRFEDIVSEYGTAAYFWDADLFLKNVIITNSRATVTGGAIALVSSRAEIENSTFVNLYAPKNGGAIYCDMNGWNKANYNEIVIANSTFENCSSDFGGAIALMCGELKISNSTFNNNFAEYDGGAIYTSQSYLIDINNSTFSNNRLNHTADGGLSFGGALFTAFSEVSVTINNTRFINNSNNAVYGYANNMTVSNSYFENNWEAIRSVYPIESNLNGNEYNGDGIVEKDYDEFYRLIANSSSIKLVLINSSIDVNNLPSRFNAFDWGWVTPFKNQGFSGGGCWCFSTVSVLETALLKSTGVAYDFSEQNLQKLLMQYSKYGNSELVEAGQTDIAAEFLISWWGPVPDELDTFSMIGKVTRIIPLAENIHVQAVVILQANESIDAIKRAILKYGSITSDFLSDTSSPNFNNVTSAYYCNRTGIDASHAIAVVGWDDNYSASNFVNTPPGNGAWIIKNSYGNESFDHGFVYVSYYDNLIFKTSQSVAFVFSNLENYTKNYQTDIGGEVGYKYKGKTYSYKNSYLSIGNDMISAVGTYFDSADENYTLKVYVNGALKLTQRGTSPFRGFHTVVLSKEIPIKTGDSFTAVMEKNSVPVLNNSNTFFKKGVSFVNDGSGWKDVSLDNNTVVLKVYTKELPDPLTTSASASDVSCVYNGGKYLTVTLRDIYGDPIKNVKVAVVLNGKTYNPTTNSKGQAKVLLNSLAPKSYTAKITYKGSAKYAKSTATAKVTVKKANVKMTAKVKKFKKSVKTKKYAITLKTNKNKVMKGVKVTLKVKGKTYTAKTNSKGKATFKITKLTKKGKYTAVVKYGGSKYYNKLTKKVKITIK